MLAPIFAPTVTSRDLLETPNFQGYIRLHLNEAAARPFSFRNEPDETPGDLAGAARLVANTRRRWGVPAEKCDRLAEERQRRIEAIEKEATLA